MNIFYEKSRIFFLFFLFLVNISPSLKAQEIPKPNPIILDKEAVKVTRDANGNPLYNTWDITLNMNMGSEVIVEEIPADIVLIIDRSGSMKGSRLDAAKRAANKFIERLIKASSITRIALISYNDDVTINSGFTNDINSLKNKINSLKASGDTFTQGALHEARTLLSQSTSTNKHIVILTDGLATKQYRLKGLSETYFTRINQGDPLATKAIEAAANNTKEIRTTGPDIAKNTSNMRVAKALDSQRFYNYNEVLLAQPAELQSARIEKKPLTFYYYFPANAAVSEANFAKKEGIKVHSIALDFQTSQVVGKEAVKKLASPNAYYQATSRDLEKTFEKINIFITPPFKRGFVEDVIGSGFAFQNINNSQPITSSGNIVSKVNVSEGDVTYDPPSRKITWSFNLSDPNQILTMSYRVHFDATGTNGQPQINTTSTKGPDIGGYDTNQWAKLKFGTPGTGKKEIDFPRPTVKPLKDTDIDEIPDFYDIDDDNDGIPDVVELADNGQKDSDGDGIIDSLDLDSDNDGILDIDEASENGDVDRDTNNDGKVDDITDTDKDGLADVFDVNRTIRDAPANPIAGRAITRQPIPDTDGERKPDFQDIDSDNDGISDLSESGKAPNLDRNNDGKIDITTDTDGDGIVNLADVNNGGTPSNEPDTDGDGIPNHKDLDSDNDSINDIDEAGITDANGDGLSDSNVVTSKPRDTDGDGRPNNLDLDSNGNGKPDSIDSYPYNGTEVPQSQQPSADENKDGLVDMKKDTDKDGIADVVDGKPKAFGDKASICEIAPNLGKDITTTRVGISTLQRNGEWLKNTKLGAYLVIESTTKGLVVPRLSSDDIQNNIGNGSDVEVGMIVWDTTENCLKMFYDYNNSGTNSWHCISNTTCTNKKP